MTQHIPVLILTSNDTNESQIESFRTGADDYIIKPFNKRKYYRQNYGLCLRTRSDR